MTAMLAAELNSAAALAPVPPSLSTTSSKPDGADVGGGKGRGATGRAVTPTVSQCISTSSSSVASSTSPRLTPPSASSPDPSPSPEPYPPASVLAAVDARNISVLEAALNAKRPAKALDVSKALHAVLFRIPSADDVQPNTEWDEEVRTTLAVP